MLISFEKSVEILPCVEHTPGDDVLDRWRYIKMGQGDEPPAKKRKWKWSTDTNRKNMPQLIMRRRSSEDFFQQAEVITDELPDLDIRSTPPTSPRKAHKQRTPSRTFTDTADKFVILPKAVRTKSDKLRTKSLDCDSSNNKSFKDVKKHRHKSEQHRRHHHHHHHSSKSGERSASSPSPSHKCKRNHHKHSNHKHRSKDKTLRRSNEVDVHNHDVLDGQMRDCVNGRVKSEKPVTNNGEYDQKLLSEFLRTGKTGKEIDTSTEIEYERDTDRDSCDGRSDTNVTSGSTSPTSMKQKLKFNISATKKLFASVNLKRKLLMAPSPSDTGSTCSSVSSKRVRRVSADTTSSHLIKSVQSCDSVSDAGSVSSNANRHFLDALSDFQDESSGPVEQIHEDDRTVDDCLPQPQVNEFVDVDTQDVKTEPSEPERQPEARVSGNIVVKSEPQSVRTERSLTPIEEQVVVKTEIDSSTETVVKAEPRSPLVEEISQDAVVNSNPASPPCIYIDSDSLPDLDAPACIPNAFESDLDLEPSSLLGGDGRVIEQSSCHPSTNSLNLRTTYEFTEIHVNAVDANFQEGHDRDALDLMHDFTTPVRAPTRQLIENVLNVMKDSDSGAVRFQGYELLQYVHHLHPPDRRLPFAVSLISEVMDHCEILLKGGGNGVSNNDLIGIILTMQYCVSSLESELMSRKLGSRRDIGKSVVSRGFNLEVNYGKIAHLIAWFELGVRFDDLIQSRLRVTDQSDDSGLGCHKTLLGELQKILCLAIAVSNDPVAHCSRVARSLYHLMDNFDDATEDKILRSISSPLLESKVMELLTDDLTNLSEDVGKCCTMDDVRYVNKYFQAEWKVQEEHLTQPLHRRAVAVEPSRPSPNHKPSMDKMKTFFNNVKKMDLEDDVQLAQLECQLEALELAS